MRCRCSSVAKKELPVEAMMEGSHFPAGPVTEFTGKSMAGSHGKLRTLNRLPCEKPFQSSIRPQPVFAAAEQVAAEIAGGIERIPAQQNLRHGRIPDCEIARR